MEGQSSNHTRSQSLAMSSASSSHPRNRDSQSGDPAHEAAIAEILKEIPPAISAALQHFHADLDALLRDHAGKWVAYGREGRIAFGDSQRVLNVQCLDAGLNEDDFIVCKIEPFDDAIEVLYDV
jgi:hypothetical protein